MSSKKQSKAKPTLLSAEPNSQADLQYTDDISTDSESTQNKEPRTLRSYSKKQGLFSLSSIRKKLHLKNLSLYMKKVCKV